jgi:predicted phosphodiesterase
VTLYLEIQAYLQELADHLGYADAAEALGLARGSHKTLKRVYAEYEVIPPSRVNQYGRVAVESDSKPDTDEFIGKVVWVPLSRAQRRKTGFERAVVMSDIHVPFHDERAIEVAFALIEDVQPDVVFIAGDLVDFYSVSKYEKDPVRKLHLSSELEACRLFLEALRKAAGEAEIVYVQGNHEMRLEAFIQDKAPELTGLEELRFESLLRLEEYGIQYIRGKRNTKTAYVEFGGILIGHFDAIGQQAGDTAKRLLNKYRQPVVQGHCHRLAMIPYTHPDGTVYWGCESGCLADLDPEYVEVPNWQHGMVVITREVDTDRSHIQLVPITDYKALYNDVVYASAA